MTPTQPQLSYDYPERLPVAVVGAGAHCARHILPCLRYLPVDLVAVAETDRRRGMQTARLFGAQRFYPDYETLLEKESVKAVVISLPTSGSPSSPYVDVASAALAGGAHVWAQAPGAGELADITKRYTDSAIKGRAYLMVGHRRPFMPGYEALRALLEHHKTKPSAFALWCVVPDQDGAQQVDQGVDLPARVTNPLALLLDLFGEPKAVQWVWHSDKSGVAMTLTYASGLVGTLQCTTGADPERHQELLCVYAKAATLTVRDGLELTQEGVLDGAVTSAERLAANGVLVRRPTTQTGAAAGLEASGYLGSLRFFCEAILAGKPPSRMTIVQLMYLMNVQASLRSGRERQWDSPGTHT